MAPSAGPVGELARSFLLRQSWFRAASTAESAPIEIVAFDVLSDSRPGLGRVLLSQGDRTFQLLLGWRSSQEIGGNFVRNDRSLLGAADDNGESVVVYDALEDAELALRILEVATEGREHATRVRTVSSLVSHASLVFDERLFMKCYRVLEPGIRPEIEVSMALDEAGFNALMAPIARWSAHGYDLSFVREFQPSALEGRLLALTSLRDLLAHAATSEEPIARFGQRTLRAIDDLAEAAASAGGDLSSEMIRLGATTAHLHIALGGAFGDFDLDEQQLVSGLPEGLSGVGGISSEIAQLRPGSLGRAIRLHGDFHLRRVMRSELGWLVAGFSDDPLYNGTSAPSLAARFGSPLEDLADMCFALQEVASEAVSMRPSAETEIAAALGAAWTRRNREAFLQSYLANASAANLLPAEDGVRDLLLRALVAERRLRYEAAAAA